MSTPAVAASAFATNLVRHSAAHLRAGGHPVPASALIDATTALSTLDWAQRERVVVALRTTLAKDQAAAALLDSVLRRLLPATATGGAATAASDTTSSSETAASIAEYLHRHDDEGLAAAAADAVQRWGGDPQPVRTARHRTQRVLRGVGLHAVLQKLLALEYGDTAPTDETDRRLAAGEAGEAVRGFAERIAELVRQQAPESEAHIPEVSPSGEPLDTPITRADSSELAALCEAVRPLGRRLATRMRTTTRRGHHSLDMRATVRASISTGGVPVNTVLRRRRRVRPELAVLCDVSGSMEQFAPFSLALTQAVSSEFDRIRTWVFIDGIVEVSELLATSSGVVEPRQLLGHRGLVNGDGRSDYAAALGTFLAGWPEAVGPRTNLLIIGDARSHDRVSARTELAMLALARRIYWFNPEPVGTWDTDDSRAGEYAELVDGMFEVATLRQLAAAITHVR